MRTISIPDYEFTSNNLGDVHAPYPPVDETNNSLELMVIYMMGFVSATRTTENNEAEPGCIIVLVLSRV